MVANVGFLTLLNFGWFAMGPFATYAKVVFLGYSEPESMASLVADVEQSKQAKAKQQKKRN